MTLDQFCCFDHALVSPAGGAFEGPTDAALAKVGRHRRVCVSLPSFLRIPELLEADDLLAVVPARVLHGHERRLQARRPPVELPAFDVIAVWHRRLHGDPSHQWLRNRLGQAAARLS